VAYFWTHITGETGGCASTTFIADATYTHCSVNIWSDLTLCILPFFVIWNLNMNIRSKISVALILSLGALYVPPFPLSHQLLITCRSSIATIVRVRYVYQLALTNDFLFANADVAIWSTVEVGLCITAGAMICLRPLFHTYLSGSWIQVTSRARSTSARTSASPYFRRSDNELPAYRTPQKRIHVETVTTVTETHAGDQDIDIEGLRGSGSKRASMGETVL
jgi:hypothetical protein